MPNAEAILGFSPRTVDAADRRVAPPLDSDSVKASEHKSSSSGSAGGGVCDGAAGTLGGEGAARLERADCSPSLLPLVSPCSCGAGNARSPFCKAEGSAPPLGVAPGVLGVAVGDGKGVRDIPKKPPEPLEASPGVGNRAPVPGRLPATQDAPPAGGGGVPSGVAARRTKSLKDVFPSFIARARCGGGVGGGCAGIAGTSGGGGLGAGSARC